MSKINLITISVVAVVACFGYMIRRLVIVRQYSTATTIKASYSTSNNNLNQLFYENKIKSRPESIGEHIDAMHKTWFGDYTILERHHAYIQWLFPIKAESAFNEYSKPLSTEEQLWFINAVVTPSNTQAQLIKDRVIRSYRMMLDFYGMELVDEENGIIQRSDQYLNRFKHLNNSYHNFLRISRILQFLGLVGLEHYKLQFIGFMMQEMFIHGNITNAQSSCIHYWLPTLACNHQRLYYDQIFLQKTIGQSVQRQDLQQQQQQTEFVGTANEQFNIQCLDVTLPPDQSIPFNLRI
jgi:hypothetical protein